MRLRPLDDLLEEAKVYEIPRTLLETNILLLNSFALTRNAKLLDELVVKNKGLVAKIALRYMHSMGNDLTFEDLVSAGMEGLIKAIERFRPSKGNALSTYASHWIRQSIAREIDKTGFRIRIPTHLMQKLRRISAFERLYAEPATDEELSRVSGYSIGVVRMLRRVKAQMLPNWLSIDQPLGMYESADASSLAETVLIADDMHEDHPPEEKTLEDDLNARIGFALDRLAPIQRKIIVRRFGLFGNEPETLESIGSALKLTRERIRQIEKKGLKKLSKIAKHFFINTDFSQK